MLVRERKVRYFDWEFERVDIVKILEFLISQHLFLKDLKIPLKAYQIVEHGQIPEELLDKATAENLRESLEKFRQRVFRERQWTSWQTGIGGVFFNQEGPEFFIPMLDLEVISTENLADDMKHLEGGLKSLNMDGSVVRSGDVGIGSYFFVGHEPQTYFPDYWQFMGRALDAFTFGGSENAAIARKLGNRLSIAPTRDASINIADEILACFPSIRTGQVREGLLVDPRWIGHKLKDGFTILRQTPGKSYEDKPLQVAGYY